MKEFLWPVRVYYEDTDSGGVVYYANYLKYLERARTELLRRYGFEQDQLIEKENIIFAVRSLSMEYIKPARFNDLLQVSAELVRVGPASLTFRQEIVRDNDNCLLNRAEVKIACLQADKMLPCAIPEIIRKEITYAD